MLIDGRALAREIRAEIAQSVKDLQSTRDIIPGLATVLVGDDPASHSYVRGKRRACEEVGMRSFAHELPADVSQADLEALVRQLNDDPTVHGILVQLPLPKHIQEEAVLDLIGLAKDVDGFHPNNIGMLALRGREPNFIPATPQGIMAMLKAAETPLEGAQAVVIGRSNIVGLPVSLLLMQANATVTIAHSRTQNLQELCRTADVLVAAVGRPEMVTADWVKPGATVIDVGTNRVEDATREKGYRVTGDVDTTAVEPIARAVSPVPGGVGPLTITMVIQNTLRAAMAS